VDCQSYGHQSAVDIIERFIPDELKNAYETLTNDLLALIDSVFEPLPAQQIRLHADCHVGNILSREGEFHFVDFDDARMGPAIQDIWMLMSGDTQQREHQLSIIGEGYNTFREFPVFEVPLIEPLRALRMMHHAAWLARRWDDPAFPIAFPWFATPRYWEQHILDLREQFAAIQEPALNFY
jgi:Ser/Thr protein kinase RdoA (MazF antagonist)